MIRLLAKEVFRVFQVSSYGLCDGDDLLNIDRLSLAAGERCVLLV